MHDAHVLQASGLAAIVIAFSREGVSDKGVQCSAASITGKIKSVRGCTFRQYNKVIRLRSTIPKDYYTLARIYMYVCAQRVNAPIYIFFVTSKCLDSRLIFFIAK